MKERDTTVKSCSFPKKVRLLSAWEFERLRKIGKQNKSKHYSISYAPSVTEFSRLGIIVSKKVSKSSYQRNLVKRRIKEYFRLNRVSFKKNIDLVVVARANSNLLKYKDTNLELNKLLTKCQIL